MQWGGCVRFAAIIYRKSAFDKFALAVDNAACAPRPLSRRRSLFVREDGATLNDAEAQFLVDEIISVELVFYGVGVVKVINIRHQPAACSLRRG